MTVTKTKAAPRKRVRPLPAGLDPEEAALEREFRRGRDRRLRQRTLLEDGFKIAGVSYKGLEKTRQLDGPARRVYDVLCGLYVASVRANDKLAYELAVDEAPAILAGMTVPVLRNGVWTRISIEPNAYQYGARFFERGLGWAQCQERKERREGRKA